MVWVCVCVRARARMRERERERMCVRERESVRACTEVQALQVSEAADADRHVQQALAVKEEFLLVVARRAAHGFANVPPVVLPFLL
jgi:hypothetical protein